MERNCRAVIRNRVPEIFLNGLGEVTKN